MLVKLLSLVPLALAEPPHAHSAAASHPHATRAGAARDPEEPAAPPTLVAPTRTLRPGDLVTIEVAVGQRGTILLDGCTPVELERHTETGWARAQVRSCDGTLPGILVEGTFAVSLPAPEKGQWRASAAWASGCRPGLPLAFASCSSTGTVRSEMFFVAEPDPLAPRGH